MAAETMNTDREKPDGRVQRSRRSREKLISAMIGLVDEGHLLPTGQEVADRAGMNLRTVFRHFEDMESLYAAIHEQLESTVGKELYEAPVEGDFELRFASFLRLRTRIYERIAPYQRSERIQRWQSPQLERVHATMVSNLRADLRARLPEVRELPLSIQNAIDALTSFEAWDRMRTEQDLGPRQAADALEAALRQLVCA